MVKHNFLLFYVTRDLIFNLSHPASACASGAAGVEIWRLCGREGQDSPAAPELQIPDREGAECQMQNVLMYLFHVFIHFVAVDYHPRGL